MKPPIGLALFAILALATSLSSPSAHVVPACRTCITVLTRRPPKLLSLQKIPGRLAGLVTPAFRIYGPVPIPLSLRALRAILPVPAAPAFQTVIRAPTPLARTTTTLPRRKRFLRLNGGVGRVCRTVTNAPIKEMRVSAVANEYSTERQARSHCFNDTVVWANNKSNIYHFAGNYNYGNTVAGGYMCEQDAVAQGMRAAKNETHP